MTRKNPQQQPAQTSNNASKDTNKKSPTKQQEKPTSVGQVPYFITYTQAEAIQAGYLIDVSYTAQLFSFTVPVSLTRAVWERYIIGHPTNKIHQDMSAEERYRLLALLAAAVLAWHGRQNTFCFFEAYSIQDSEKTQPERITLSMHNDARHNPSVVMTIMMMDEY